MSLHDVVLCNKYQSPVFSRFVYKRPTVKFMYSYNQTEHYEGGGRGECTIVLSQNTTVQCIFNWNTSVIGYKQWTVVFTQRKRLPRSTVNSTVSNSNSGAFSVLLFHVSSFTLTHCLNFSTKKYPLGTSQLCRGGSPL